MERLLLRHSSVVAVLALAACGGELPLPQDDGGTNIADGGVVQDAGEVTDAGEASPDAGTPDAGTPDAGEVGPVRYPGGTRHSPLTSAVAARLRTVAALSAAKENVFAKVGDSITVSSKFMHCFANPGALVLDGRTQLQSTVDHFRAGQAGTTTPFDRVSLAAGVGWRTEQMLAGTPAPIDQELDALTPSAAVFMLGTNDMGFNDLDTYGREMFTLVDRMLGRGVVPILSTVPPRASATADARVPRYNAVVRGIAQARQVPYVDLHRELEPLPSRGLVSDGVHLTAGSNACDFSAAGLQYAQNARNLLNLEALHRLRGVLQGGAAPDVAPVALSGTGTAENPFVVSSLPFVDSRDTRKEGANRLSTYPGCNSSADESGPEMYYQLDLAVPTNLRAYVISLGSSDLDIHLLGVGQTGSDCLERNHKVITRAGVQGRTYLSVDTYVSGGQALSGEYLLVVLADP
jgi:hypothetical protein